MFSRAHALFLSQGTVTTSGTSCNVGRWPNPYFDGPEATTGTEKRLVLLLMPSEIFNVRAHLPEKEKSVCLGLVLSHISPLVLLHTLIAHTCQSVAKQL